jgi:hypothetical protein
MFLPCPPFHFLLLRQFSLSLFLFVLKKNLVTCVGLWRRRLHWLNKIQSNPHCCSPTYNISLPLSFSASSSFTCRWN